MKETLDEQSRIGLMNYRMERANETMEEVGILAEHGHYNAASTDYIMLASMPLKLCC